MTFHPYAARTQFTARRLRVSPRRQRGAVLVISLLLLLIMTLLGVTAVGTTSLEERMAGNLRDSNTAFQAAEAALENGETWLATLASQPTATAACGAPPCDVWTLNVLPDLSGQSQSWWSTNSVASTTAISDVATEPRRIIEAQTFIPDSLDAGQGVSTGVAIYRVTAHGTGATDIAQAIVQTTFAKRFK